MTNGLRQKVHDEIFGVFLDSVGTQPHLSLPLTICCLSGVVAQVMNFTCQVRTQHVQPLTLSNRSNQRWNLKPVIEGQHWTGAPSFSLEPYQQNKVYEVVYKPMVMTTDGKKHQVGTAPR